MLMQERENSIALLGTETAMTLPTKLLRPAAAVARHYLSHPEPGSHSAGQQERVWLQGWASLSSFYQIQKQDPDKVLLLSLTQGSR